MQLHQQKVDCESGTSVLASDTSIPSCDDSPPSSKISKQSITSGSNSNSISEDEAAEKSSGIFYDKVNFFVLFG